MENVKGHMRKLKNCFASGFVGSVLRCLDGFESLQNGKYSYFRVLLFVGQIWRTEAMECDIKLLFYDEVTSATEYKFKFWLQHSRRNV